MRTMRHCNNPFHQMSSNFFLFGMCEFNILHFVGHTFESYQTQDNSITTSDAHERGSVVEWLARRTRDLVVAGSIPNQAML